MRHRWDLTPREAAALQARWAPRVERRDRVGRVRRVLGVDVGIRGDRAVAAAVLLSFPGLDTLEERRVESAVSFPYVPGLLSFREIPALLPALRGLDADVVFCDGHGVAHPRRFGLACHLGLWLDRPAIGTAKSILVGPPGEPGPRRGAWASVDGGVALRTRDGVRPVYVSIGHRVSLRTAIRLTLAVGGGYRIPEPTRRADRLTKR